jgi:hypothetical protein
VGLAALTSAATRAAAGLREVSAAEAAEMERELSRREAGLRQVIGLLDQTAAAGR